MTNTGHMYWALIGGVILASFVGILVYETAIELLELL
jgi:hypothetical protein